VSVWIVERVETEVGDAERPAIRAHVVDLADSLVDDCDVIELLTLLSDRCVDVLDVFAAGVVLRGAQNDLRVVAASRETMGITELFELQTEEGPCVDCLR
jgi:hypothetical protein